MVAARGLRGGSGRVCLRIRAPYASFGLYETAVAGTLAAGSGWATAARACVDAAQGIPVISFGARRVHPSVSGIRDYSAVVGGCVSCSSLQGSRLAGLTPWGSMSHAYVLLVGDTVRATMSFDRQMPPEVPRVALVDTFKDEAEESIAVARALRSACGECSSTRLPNGGRDAGSGLRGACEARSGWVQPRRHLCQRGLDARTDCRICRTRDRR